MFDFKVKKGKKFFRGPRWNFIGINRKRFAMKVYMWNNCRYELDWNKEQINKLTGHTFRLMPWYDRITGKIRPGHHKDSVRFGWRCMDGRRIEILAYAYINGARVHESIAIVPTGNWFIIEFKETHDNYIFKVYKGDGIPYSVRFKKEGTKKGILGLFIGRLYPYFGGKASAPHEMDMILKY